MVAANRMVSCITCLDYFDRIEKVIVGSGTFSISDDNTRTCRRGGASEDRADSKSPGPPCPASILDDMELPVFIVDECTDQAGRW